MGFLSKLFGGGGVEYPPLEPSHPANTRIDKFKTDLSKFVNNVDDNLEIIPSADAMYIFIGKPPGMFGIAWLQDGREHNFKTLMKEKGFSQARIQVLSDKLREAYERNMEADRFSTTVAGRKITVTPSEKLEKELIDLIHKVEDM